MKCSMRFAMQPAIYTSFFVSSVVAETLHSQRVGRSASLLQRDSALQTEAVHVLASTPHDDLMDPYAPKHAGSPTLSKYCQGGHGLDPACKADGESQELVDEIAAVKAHMRCMFHPETCPPGMEPTGTHIAHEEDNQHGEADGGTGHGADGANGGKNGVKSHTGDGAGTSSDNASKANSGAGSVGAGSNGAGSDGVGKGGTGGAGKGGAGSDGTGSGGASSGGAGNGKTGTAGASNGVADKGGAGSGGATKGGAGSGGSDGNVGNKDVSNGGAGTGVADSRDADNGGAGNGGAHSNTGHGDVGKKSTGQNGGGKGGADNDGLGSGESGNGSGSNGGVGNDGGSKAGVGNEGAGDSGSGGGGDSSNAMCTEDKFKTRIAEHHGDSDESFGVADTNRDRSVSRGEFQSLGSGVGCSVPSSNKVFEGFKGDGHDDEVIVDDDAISERVYKDELLATPQEVARRLRDKHDTPEEAFAVADSDHSNSLSEREIASNCATVAKSDACRVVQDRMGSSPTRTEYEDFVEYGHLPPATTTAAPTKVMDSVKNAPTRMRDSLKKAKKAVDSASKSTSAPTEGAGNKKVDKAIRQEARLARQEVEDKVVEIAELKHKLEEEDALDPELGRALTGMIEGGEVFSGALEDVGEGKVTDADAALAEVETSAESVEVAAFDLQTGVHPHGLKWWRFRWEYSLIEAIMLIFLILLVMITHACINKGQSITAVFMPTKMVGFSSMLNLHNITFTTCVKEFAVLGVLQGVIWIMNQFGFFDWMLTHSPALAAREPMAMAQMNGALSLAQVAASFSMHLPNTGADLVYTLRCVNMHLFLGIAFYFLVMYHVVVSAIHIFSMFLEAEDDGAHEKYQSALSIEHFLSGTPRGGLRDADVSRLTVSAGGGMPKRRTTSFQEFGSSSTSAALRWTGGCLKKTEDFQNVRRYFIHHVLKRQDLCEYLVKEAELADDKALEDTLHRIYLYRYLSVHIRKRLIEMIIIDVRIWLAMVFVLVCDVGLHVFAHVSFVEILPLYITLAFSVQVWQIRHAHSQLKIIASHEAATATAEDPSEEERHGNSFGQRHRLDLWTVRVQQLILLLICYSGARVLASPYMWTDYFNLSCFIIAVLFLLYLFHVFIGTIWIILDMIVYSLPPYINDDEKVALVETIVEAKGYSEQISMVPF